MKPLTALGFHLTFIFPATTMAERPADVLLHDTPQPLPIISFSDESSNSLTLEHWNGKVILLNIWATWCGPCRQEMPTLDRLQAALGSDRFIVIALSIDRAGNSVVRKFFDEIGIRHLDIFIDQTMKVARDLRVSGLPGTLLIGPDGQELGRLIGPAEWDTAEKITFFKTVITKQTKKEQEK